MKARKWITIGLLGVMLYQNVLPTYHALAAEDVQDNIATISREELKKSGDVTIEEPDNVNVQTTDQFRPMIITTPVYGTAYPEVQSRFETWLGEPDAEDSQRILDTVYINTGDQINMGSERVYVDDGATLYLRAMKRNPSTGNFEQVPGTIVIPVTVDASNPVLYWGTTDFITGEIKYDYVHTNVFLRIHTDEDWARWARVDTETQKRVRTVEIGDNVTKIPNDAFKDCADLTKVTMGNSVKSIGNGAFTRATKLAEINFPESLESIGNNAFGNCAKLPTNIELGENMTAIGQNAFSRTEIENLSIKGNVTDFGQHAFGDMRKLKVLDLGRTTIINNELLGSVGGNDSLHTVIMKNIESVASYGIRNARYLRTIVIGEDTSLTLKTKGDNDANTKVWLEYGYAAGGQSPEKISYNRFEGMDTETGWLIGEGLEFDTTAGNLYATSITGHTTLTRLFNSHEGGVTVTYKLPDGTDVAIDSSKKAGEKLEEPTDIAIPEGKELVGWYNGEDLWNFATDTLSDDMTLTAKFATKGTKALADLIARYEALGLVSGDYTTGTWAEYQDKFDNAKVLLNDENADSLDLQRAKDFLERAYGLLRTTIFQDLEDVLAEALALQLEREDYSPASWSVYDNAYTAGLRLMNDPDASEAQISAAVTAIRAGIEGLRWAEQGEIAAHLEAEEKKERVAANYDGASWTSYQQALAAAEEIVDAADVTKSEAETVLTNLKAGILALELSDLRKIYDPEVELERLESDYDARTWEGYRTGMLNAQLALENPDRGLDFAQNAATMLTRGIQDLRWQEQGDLYDLIAALKEDLAEADFTPESWEDYQEVLADAGEVYKKTVAEITKDEAAEELAKLEAAVAKLVPVAKADLEAFLEVEQGKNRNEDIYTTDSWNAYTSALNAAIDLAVQENPGTVQDYKYAIAAVEEAVEGLRLSEQGELADVIADNADLVEEDYTADSWKGYADAVEAATDLTDVAADDVDVEDVKAALEAVKAGLAGLILQAYADLEDLVAFEEEEAREAADYDQAGDAWNNYQEVLEDAQVMLDEGATKAELEEMFGTLTSAIADLRLQVLADLEALLDPKEANDDYTVASWSAYETAYAAGEALLDKVGVTKAEVEEAIEAINTAVAGFVWIAWDELDALADSEDEKRREAADYLAATWTPYSEKLADVKELLADENATKDDLKTAKGELEAVIAGLRWSVQGDLGEMIDGFEAEGLVEAEYTAASWQAYTTAVNNGVAVLDVAADDIDPAAVEALIDALEAAYDGLVYQAHEDLATLVAEEEVKDRQENEYAAEGFADYLAAMAAAEALLADKDATIEQLNAGKTALEGAIEALFPLVEGQLQNLVDAEEDAGRFESDYQADAWTAYQEALDNAKDVLADDSSEFDDFKDAKDALAEAIENLEAALTDAGAARKELQELHDADQGKASDYTNDSWTAYEEAKDAAAELLADADATKADLDAARDALQGAIDNLQKKVTITFVTNGGSAVKDVDVEIGEKLKEPTITRKGFTFNGWYTDKAMKNKFDFKNTAVTKGMTLYAKWTPWIAKTVSIYSSVTNKNYAVWGDLNFKTRKTTTKSLYSRTLHVRGHYSHKNGEVYYSLHNNKGQHLGFVNKKAMKDSSHKGGTHWKNGNYVTITNKNFKLWNDLNFKKVRNTSKNLFNKTYHAKVHYNHHNGHRYYSLYNNKGKWMGYLNKDGATQGPNAGGSAIKNGKRVTIKKSNWVIWNDLKFKKRNGISTTIRGNSYTVRYHHNHFHGPRYMSIYNSRGQWIGYVNENAVK